MPMPGVRTWPRRLHGPAFELTNGTKVWHDENGRLHREDGPAYEGPQLREFYVHGEFRRREWLDGTIQTGSFETLP